MSTTLNAAAAVFDPQLCASLHNDICRRGWATLAPDLPFEEGTTTWWDTYGSECDASVASRLAPQLMEFLKQARIVRPALRDEAQGNFFFYLSGLAAPDSLFSYAGVIDPDEPDANRYVVLYHATQLMGHPVGLVMDQHTLKGQVMQSLTIDDTIVEQSRRPWVPLQDILAAYLNMIDMGKITSEENPGEKVDYTALDASERAGIIAGTWRPKVWPYERPWLLKPHSQAILDRSVAALDNLLEAIEKRMPLPRAELASEIPLRTPVAEGVMGMASVAEKLISTNQASEHSFIVKFLRQVDGLLASVRPDLRFVAPGLRVPDHHVAAQPFEGLDDERWNPPILLFHGELRDGTTALTTFPGGIWNHPFAPPYKERTTPFPSGLWIAEHKVDNPNYDNACRLLLPDEVVLAPGRTQHYAKSTDGFLLEQPGAQCEGLAAGLYQTSCNIFVGRHEVLLFHVLEHWVRQVEDGTWAVDRHGVAGGMEKWAEADESEAMAEKYRLPYTW
ncbi:hypothetical protein PG993_005981 [Apiospora rasikravindrae]|uniref:Uncharacterized protein n=1 Tax=Apiospora rasikravindrae TaxID=990691 RepID=A0ABR1TC32_9PEZI